MKRSIYNYLLILVVSILLASCSNKDISFKNKFYELQLNGNTGSIKSVIKNGKNLVYTADCEDPLFTIRFRDASKGG